MSQVAIKMRLVLFLVPLSTAAFSPTHSSIIYRSFGLIPSSIFWKDTNKISLQQNRNINPSHQCRRQRQITTTMQASENGVSDTNNMKILGVCGGIGSGKSTACQLMVDSLGCVARIDADKLAHVVYEPGSKALEEISKEFGKDILDGSDNTQIDRKKLGAIVFSDAASMSKLEKIVWPHVRDKIEERIEEIKNKHGQQSTTYSSVATTKHDIIIVEAALLLETDWHDLLDGLWVIQASESVAVQRLKDNRGLTEEEALVRIHAQAKRKGIGSATSDNGGISSELQAEMKDGRVTAVITNDGSLEDLQKTLQRTLCDASSFSK